MKSSMAFLAEGSALPNGGSNWSLSTTLGSRSGARSLHERSFGTSSSRLRNFYRDQIQTLGQDRNQILAKACSYRFKATQGKEKKGSEMDDSVGQKPRKLLFIGLALLDS